MNPLGMVTEYVQNVDHWEGWQHAYRFGVILILPPEPLRTQVNDLRSRHDPRSQAYCDGHISLTRPLPRALAEQDWAELTSIAAGLHPVKIRYGPLKHYLPHPGVCLQIEPQRDLDQIRAAIETAAVFADAPPRRHSYSAHMTIAEFITTERTEALMEELRSTAPVGDFTCDRLSYMVPDSTFRFSERATLILTRCDDGSAGAPASASRSTS
jgi:2'-5' RNA ligase